MKFLWMVSLTHDDTVYHSSGSGSLETVYPSYHRDCYKTLACVGSICTTG